MILEASVMYRSLPGGGGRWLLIPAVLLLLSGAGCGGNSEEEWFELAPGLSPETASHLMADDAESFAAYAGAEGILPLLKARSACLGALAGAGSTEEYCRTMEIFHPILVKICDALGDIYFCPEYRRDLLFWRALPPERSYSLRLFDSDCAGILGDEKLTPPEKEIRFHAALDTLQKVDYPIGTARTRHDLSVLLMTTGRTDECIEHLRSALREAENAGLRASICQAAGTLAQVLYKERQYDEAIAGLEKGLRIARESRLPGQASRLLSVYAIYYWAEGRFALASDFFRQAREICREYKGGYFEISPLVHTMQIHAAFECWEMNENLLPRAKMLLRSAESEERGLGLSMNRLSVREIEARTLLALGRFEDAEEVYARIREEGRDLPFPDRPYTHFFHIKGLIEADRPDAALVAVEEAVRSAEESPRTPWLPLYRLLEARAHHALGDSRSAEKALALFEESSGGPESMEYLTAISYYPLKAMLLDKAGDRNGAVEALGEGLRSVQSALSGGDGSAEAYLNLDRSSPLRNALHDLLGTDARVGYGVELLWRELYRTVGERGIGKIEPDTNLEALPRSIADRTLEKLADRDALHLLYQVRGKQIFRYSASRAGIRCDTLLPGMREVQKMAGRVVREMGRDPGESASTIPDELCIHLRSLAEILLPEEIVRPTGKRREIFITGDRFLTLFPFETLNVGEEGYTPLLATGDVAYLRGGAAGWLPEAGGGPGVVVADPKVAAGILRSYPLLADLARTGDEGKMVADLAPGSLFFAAESATEENLFSAWENAPFLYLAGHVIRDPQAPYVTFLPMAPPEGENDPAAGCLDIEDIRAADLSRCALVVLSGCASGAPFVAREAAAPSLGDAFLDAGARAAVQTFWRVRDDQAAELMSRFIAQWQGEGRSPVEALLAARRAMLEGPDGIVHPFGWAAYTIKLNGL